MHMDEFELRKLLGNESFDRGMKLVSSGCVKDAVDIGYGLSVIPVTCGGQKFDVVVREYANGHPHLYDCECCEKGCDHLAAAKIKNELADKCEKPRDDEEAIEDIEEMIDCLLDDIREDREYDEEANYYEEWEIRKYGLEPHNNEIEEYYTGEICARITEDVSDPDDTVILFHKLQMQIQESEYDNGGFDSALRGYSDKISSAFRLISPETLVSVLSENRGYRSCWADEYLEYVPKEVRDLAEKAMMESSGPLSRSMRQQLLEKGAYERFLSSSSPNLDDLLKVLSELSKRGRTDEAKSFAEKLSDFDVTGYSWFKIVEGYKLAGMKEKALAICQKLFLEDPREEILRRVKELDNNSSRAMVDEAFESYKDSMTVKQMVLFAKNGHVKEVEEYMVRKKLKPTYGPGWIRDNEFPEYVELAYIFARNDLYESAGAIAREIISTRLHIKDSNRYNDAVDMLRLMDTYGGFEHLELPHSQYKTDLRARTKTMRKFWGLYDGTWIDKETEKRRRQDWW